MTKVTPYGYADAPRDAIRKNYVDPPTFSSAGDCRCGRCSVMSGYRRRVGLRRQKDEREDRAAIRPGVYPGTPAMRLHDLRDDSETQPGAVRGSCLAPPEALEDPTVQSVWDEEKVKVIAASQAVDIHLTSFIEERSFGRSASYLPLEDTQVGHGFTDWHFSLVVITFADQAIETHTPPKPPTIGKWIYEVFGNEREGYIGRLHFTFFDQDRAIRTALRQAHASSLASGVSTTRLGILKEEGVGAFSVEDRERGYSYRSRFPFCGMQVTERYQSRNLKKWAVPRFDEDFSLDGAPT